MTAEFTRFVVLLTAIAGRQADPALIRRHVAYLRMLDREGRLVMAGPFADGEGGMIVLRAADLTEARRIAADDPFVQEGVRAFTLRVWELSCEENNHMGMG